MLRVTIEVVPNGDERRAEVLERFTIANSRRLMGTRGQRVGYRVWTGSHERTPDALVWHDRAKGALPLVADAARALARGRLRRDS